MHANRNHDTGCNGEVGWSGIGGLVGWGVESLFGGADDMSQRYCRKISEGMQGAFILYIWNVIISVGWIIYIALLRFRHLEGREASKYRFPNRQVG